MAPIDVSTMVRLLLRTRSSTASDLFDVAARMLLDERGRGQVGKADEALSALRGALVGELRKPGGTDRIRSAFLELTGPASVPGSTPQAQPPEDDGVLAGAPGSPGRVSGPARLVREDADLGRIAPGDVVVCRSVAPAWRPGLTPAGGLVVEAGGLSSPGLRIARHLGIPAVRLPDATTLLRDGARVSLHGEAGRVRVDASAAAAA